MRILSWVRNSNFIVVGASPRNRSYQTWSPTLAAEVANAAAALPPQGSSSRRGAVTRAAGEGPRNAGIDGQCESAHEADSRRNDSVRRSKEAEAHWRSHD